MPRAIPVLVPEYILDDLFEALEVWNKALDGRLTAHDEGTRAPAKMCEGGESFFVRFRNTAGLDVARVHYIRCPDGHVERWPSALRFADVTVYRSGHQARSER